MPRDNSEREEDAQEIEPRTNPAMAIELATDGPNTASPIVAAALLPQRNRLAGRMLPVHKHRVGLSGPSDQSWKPLG